MEEVRLDGVMLVMVIAVTVPLLLGLFPRLPIPGSVLEITAGILVGPAVFGWVTPDETIEVLSKLGVAFLLFLAGMELDFRYLRGRPLRLGLIGYVVGLAIALACTVPLGWADVVLDPALVAIILSATALGIVLPVLKDAGQTTTPFGHLVIVSASVAEFGSIIVLSMLFSGSGTPDPIVTVGKLVVLVLAVLVIAVVAARAGKWDRLNAVLFRLQDTSAQIRIRVAILLLLALLVLSDDLKFDAILGAFMAGALLAALTDEARDDDFGHFHHKLEGVGFGFFVPVFFVSTGLAFPLDALLDDSSALLRIPTFLVILVLARGLPALLFRRDMTRSETIAAGLMQATSLSFVVVATKIGVDIGELRPINAASLVAAGMLSVLAFPALALAFLKRDEDPAAVETREPIVEE